jgi:hypothetical protein
MMLWMIYIAGAQTTATSSDRLPVAIDAALDISAPIRLQVSGAGASIWVRDLMES